MEKELLELYSDYLISSFGQTTATGLSSLVNHSISHDKITRMLSRASSSSLRFWQKSKKQLPPESQTDGVLIIDDTLIAKPHSRESASICWHWDHSQRRHVKGINLLTLLYQSPSLSLPVSAEVITKQEYYVDSQGKQKRRSSVSKNEHMRTQLQYASRLQLQYHTVIADVWFSSAENMLFIAEKLQKRFVLPLKSNRKVFLSKSKKSQGICMSLSELAIQENTPVEIYIKGVGFALQLIKKVFTNGDGSTGVLYLVSNDMHLDAQAIASLYQRRWRIECYHKSLKQNSNIAACPAHGAFGQFNHIFAAIYGYIKLEALKLKTTLNHFALRQKLYLKALAAALTELQQLQRNPNTIIDFA